MRSRLALWLWARRHAGRSVIWRPAGWCTVTSELGLALELHRTSRAETATVALQTIRDYERLVAKVANALRAEAVNR